MDLKKEIKLSDLLRRKPKDPAEAETEARPTAEEKPKKERSSFLSFRKPKEGDEAAAPAEPKAPKESRRKKEHKRKAAPPLPHVPLMRAFNLLPREEGRRETVAAEDGARRPGTAQLVLAVVGLLLVAALASIFLITNATVADKQTELDGLKGELAALNVAAQKPSAPEPDGTLVQERNNRTGALATALGQRVAWDRLLRELSLVLPDDVWLTRLAAKAGGAGAVDPNAPPDPTAAPPASTFEIGGYTRKQEHVAQLLSRMAVLPQVAAVQLLGATKTKIGEEDVIEFTISATMKAAGAGGTA
jgi:Tfp pilus assembly protein PilN